MLSENFLKGKKAVEGLADNLESMHKGEDLTVDVVNENLKNVCESLNTSETFLIITKREKEVEEENLETINLHINSILIDFRDYSLTKNQFDILHSSLINIIKALNWPEADIKEYLEI